MKNMKIILLFFLITSFFVPSAFAQLESLDTFFWGQEFGLGTRAMGMGGAFIGVADDYSAVYWNPAGMGQLRRMEMNIGFSHNQFENETDFLGNVNKSKDTLTRLNSIGLVVPVPTYQGSLVFGFGYNKVRDYESIFTVDGYNESWAAFPDFFDMDPNHTDENIFTDVLDNVQQFEEVIEKGSLNHYTFSGSMEIQKDFFLGASLNLVRGANEYIQHFEEEDVLNAHSGDPYQDEFGNQYWSDLNYWVYDQTIKTDIKATNFKVGALYRFNNMLRLGATISTPTTYKMVENWSDEWDIVYDADYAEEMPPAPAKNEYKFKEPYAFGVGASLKVLNFLFAADAEYKDWSQAEYLTDPPIASYSKQDLNYAIQNDLQAVTKYHLGAEMYIPVVRAKVRAGYFNEPSAYKSADIRPDKQYYTAGASLMLDKQVMVDLGYVLGDWEMESYGALTNTVVKENRKYSKIVGTLSIRF